VRTVRSGLQFGESPRWHEGRLWVSDWGAQEIIAIDPEGGEEIVAHDREAPVCIDWLPDGRMLLVAGRDGLLLRREPDGALVTHCDLTRLAAPPWNDIVVDGRGNAYVGNTGFDFPGGDYAPGILALVTPDGSARQVADGVAFPNGVAVTPDGKTLILAESYGNRLTAYDIAGDGSLSPGRVWADAGDVVGGQPVAVGLGEELHRIDLDRGCFACMLGGADGRTLFMVVAQWDDAATGTAEGSGQVLATDAPAPRAGRP